MSDKENGLYQKYVVTRTDGSSVPGGKHADCDYFVLDLVHDPYAFAALETYAENCASEYPHLYDDLNDKLAKTRHRQCIGPKRKPFLCRAPSVIPLGNGVWFCVEHAADYEHFEHDGEVTPGLCKRGRETLARRRAR